MPLPLLSLGAVLATWTRLKAAPSAPIAGTYLRVYTVYVLLSQRWLFVSIQNLLGDWLTPLKGVYMGRFFDLPASLLIATLLAMLVFMLRDAFATFVWARRGVYAAAGALVAFLLLEPKLFLFYRNGIDGWGEFNYEVRALDELRKKETEPFRVASVLPLQPSYAYAQGLETADGWANLYPRAYREYWLRVIAPLLAAVPGAKAIFDPDKGKPQDHYIFLGADLANPGVGLLPGEDPQRAVREGFDVDGRFDLKLLGQLNVKYLLSEFPLKGVGLTKVHSPAQLPAAPYSRDWATGLLSPPSGPIGGKILNVLRIAYSDTHAAIRRKSRGKDIFIYQIEQFMPRYRLVREVLVEPAGTTVLERLNSFDAATIRNTAVVESVDAGYIGIGQRQNFADGSIQLLAQSPERIDLRVAANGNAYMVVAHTWNRFWRAEVDGRKAELTRTNHTQLGLRLSEGEHSVRLVYSPPYVLDFN